MQDNQIFAEIDNTTLCEFKEYLLSLSVANTSITLHIKIFLKETFFFIAHNKMDIAIVEKHLQ